jgi:hypothetical protein
MLPLHQHTLCRHNAKPFLIWFWIAQFGWTPLQQISKGIWKCQWCCSTGSSKLHCNMSYWLHYNFNKHRISNDLGLLQDWYECSWSEMAFMLWLNQFRTDLDDFFQKVSKILWQKSKPKNSNFLIWITCEYSKFFVYILTKYLQSQ